MSSRRARHGLDGQHQGLSRRQISVLVLSTGLSGGAAEGGGRSPRLGSKARRSA
jgi:hypothetical protein